jgi:hypothetical protein
VRGRGALPSTQEESQVKSLTGSRTLKLAAAAALLLGITVASDTALAQQPPDDGNETTTGTVNQGSTNASIFNIADLKSDDGPTCTAEGALDATDYDDDPGGGHARPDLFHVAPNLGDNPLQCANKYVFINNPSSVLQVQKTISAVLAWGTGEGPASTRVVFNDELPGSAIVTGTACQALLGSATTGPSVAHGLITTGQKTAAEITSISNGCTQNTVGVLVNPFPVSKHLPPGWYRQCAVLATSGGGATAPFCTYFHIEAVTGFTEDVTTIDYGVLTQNVVSIDGGDFDIINTPDVGTVMGLGNTSPILQVSYSEMENEYGDPTQEADNKFITRDFDVQINRRDSAGAIIAFQKVGNMLGGADPDAADPFLGATVATLGQICLEPNEPLKVDFSLTPRDVLYSNPGVYIGLARIVITTSGACTPTLGDAEDATGDTDGDPFNNQTNAVTVEQTAPTT